MLTYSCHRDLRRFVFGLGQYVSFHDNRIGLIDHIFVQDVLEPHIFVILTPVDILAEEDPVLRLHKVQQQPDNPIIVGINAIHSKRLYIFPINKDTTVWVDWQVEWL